jgi:hypothetical protein
LCALREADEMSCTIQKRLRLLYRGVPVSINDIEQWLVAIDGDEYQGREALVALVTGGFPKRLVRFSE